jgi:hypothetical protein
MPGIRLGRVLALPILLLGFGLAACDEAEQDRVLLYEKGTYLGPSDPPLGQEAEDALRARATLQAGS